MHKLVVGRAQHRVARAGAKTGTVDQALRVFDAKTHAEGFGLHGHTALVQHGEGVARAVAQGQNNVLGNQLFAAGQTQAAHLIALDVQVNDMLFKTNFTAQSLDLSAHLFDHADESESSDVGLVHEEDFFGCAGFHKLHQHLACQVPWVADLAPQFAVRKSARTTFAKLHIRFGVEHTLAPQAPGIFGALAHGTAALQHDGAQAHLCQDQRSKEAAGAKTNHQWASAPGAIEVKRGMTDESVAGVGAGAQVRITRKSQQHCGLVGLIRQRAVQCVDQHHGGTLACVVAAFEDRKAQQLRRREFQTRQDRQAQLVISVPQGQAQFGDAKHGVGARVQPEFSPGSGLSRLFWLAYRRSSCCACVNRAPS